MTKRNRLCLFITFIMTAIMACSSSQTFTVLKYGPGAESRFPNLPLSKSLEPGMVLNVITSTTGHSDFDIKDIQNNILMRINPRVHLNKVAFNSHINGKWGTELTTSKIIIKSGLKYSLHIVHQLSGYRIFVNGEELYFYKHRSQNIGVTFEMLTGGKFFMVSHKLNEPKWAVQKPNNGMYIEEFSDNGKESPHEIQLQGSYPLSSIVITGIINSNADSVDFNLTNFSDEKIFYFSIRFTENSVVRNSYLEGVWGKEERNGGFVFKRNERFTLAIDVEVDYYKIYVDGVEYITYKHRTSYYNAIKLQISAGITIFKTIYQK